MYRTTWVITWGYRAGLIRNREWTEMNVNVAQQYYTNSHYRSTRSRRAGQVLLALFPHYFSEEVVP